MHALLKKARFGWGTRHAVVLLVAAIGTYALVESRSEFSAMHRWNRALGDMSVILVALAMASGPLARISKTFRVTIPWRREVGIYGVLLAFVHTAIIIGGWVDWDLIRLFGYELHPLTNLYVMLQHGFGLANAIGLVALAYGLVLALSSNNRSQRFLGGSVWKFLQQSSYVLWVLIVVHTAYFLYLHFQSFHRTVPEANWAQWPFAVLVMLVVALQVAAFLKTWRRRNSPPRGLEANLPT